MGELYFQATCRRAVLAPGEREIKDSEDMIPLDESIRECTMSVKKGEITFKFLQEGYVASYDYRSMVPTNKYTLDTFTLKYYGFVDKAWGLFGIKKKPTDQIRLFAGEEFLDEFKNRSECKEWVELGNYYNAEIAETIIPHWKIRIDPEQIMHLNKFLDKNVTKSLLKITDSSPNDLEITYSVVQSANPHSSFSPTTGNPDPPQEPRGGGFPDDPNEEKNPITQNPRTQNMYIIQPNIYSIKYSS
jgi:hypothetical protein